MMMIVVTMPKDSCTLKVIINKSFLKLFSLSMIKLIFFHVIIVCYFKDGLLNMAALVFKVMCVLSFSDFLFFTYKRLMVFKFKNYTSLSSFIQRLFYNFFFAVGELHGFGKKK